MKALPAEKRIDAVWSHCASDAVINGGEGLLLGITLSLLAKRPYMRGVLGGAGAGIGLGWAGRKCNEKHGWLQTLPTQ